MFVGKTKFHANRNMQQNKRMMGAAIISAVISVGGKLSLGMRLNGRAVRGLKRAEWIS
jgi:hypothetical protein